MKNSATLPANRAKIFIALLLTFVIAFSMLPLTAEASGRNYLQETKDNYPWYKGQVYYKDFVPHAPHTFTPYSGNDYTPDAIKARLMAMKTNYPQGMPWSPSSNGVYCDMFATMMQEAAFGLWSTMVIPVRSHENWDQLQVGDFIGIRNSSGGGHAAIVIDINTAKTVVTIAEGNYNTIVNWGRTISMTTLKAKSGWNSGLGIYSRYAEDGSIIGYPNAITDPSKLPSVQMDVSNLHPDAVAERLNALRDVYPSRSESLDCQAFAEKVQQDVFGPGEPRRHQDFSYIRVGDHVRIRNSAGGQHSVVIIGINGDKINVVEGNVSKMVRWDFERDTKSEDLFRRWIPLWVETRYPDDKPITTPPPVENPPATTPPASNPPTATPPASNPPTTTPPANNPPASTPTPRPEPTGKALIINQSNDDNRTYAISINGGEWSEFNSNYSSFSTITLSGIKIQTVRESDILTITYKGTEYKIGPGQSLELDL